MSAAEELEREVFTVPEAAAFLRLNVKTLYKLIDEGTVPHVRIGERRIRLRRSSLVEWQAAQETKLPPSKPERPTSLPSLAGVYFVRIPSCERIKIGHATNIAVRVGSISRTCPEPAELVAFVRHSRPRELEAQLHRRFADARAHCEWFRPTAELLRFIAEETEKP